jgi:hypothetical protein
MRSEGADLVFELSIAGLLWFGFDDEQILARNPVAEKTTKGGNASPRPLPDTGTLQRPPVERRVKR